MSAPLSPKMDWALMNPILADRLNPIISIPLLSGKPLNGLALGSGATIVNHGLGRMMRGWLITDQDAAATVYRSAPMNNATLTLTSSAKVNVNLWIY